MGYKESLNDFINSQNWIFAKTMADIPHWYCLKANCDNQEDWDWFVRSIDEYGVDGQFYGKTYHYLYWGEYRYWYMDSTAESCDLINRCIIPEEERKPENFPINLKDDVSQEWRWCLVGNIIEKHLFGEEHEIRSGTKQFAPGAKVYCAPSQWGDGYENIVVIGSPRHGKKYIEVVMPCKYIENFRIQKVFNPALLKMMKESYHYWWSNTDEEKKDLIRYLKSFKSVGYNVCSNEHSQFD